MDNLSELMYLLSNRQLGKDESISTAAVVRTAIDSGDFDWIDDEERQLMFAVEDRLSDWFAVSDKIDELHEQISDRFDPPIPAFPYDDGLDTPSYFQWLDSILAKRENNYELLYFDTGFDDNIHVAALYRTDMPRVLELCKALKFHVHRATKMFDRH